MGAPRYPSTEFGYLERGAPIPGVSGAFTVSRFHEKPRRERAEHYINAGGHDWNSGMFMFAAGTFAHEAAEHMPEVWRAVRAAVANANIQGRTIWLEGAAFESSPKISFDYALMEKSRLVGVVPVDLDWSDVGSWAAVKEAWTADGDGNTLIGDVQTSDARNNLIISEGVKVAAIGVHGLAIIATSDGVLVSPLPRAAEIKGILARG
jgi:mannose-1-phosphate guanylyltransferase / mannose-6-phosphate isomerase